MILLSKYLFKGEGDLAILRNFFLGYCQSDTQTYEVSEPNYSQKRPKNQNGVTSSLQWEFT